MGPAAGRASRGIDLSHCATYSGGMLPMSHRRLPRRARPVAAFLIGAAALLAARVGPAFAGSDPVDAGLLALHRGDYSRAFEEFGKAVDSAPGDPGPLFFCVFSRWWQMIFADETPSRDAASWTAFE